MPYPFPEAVVVGEELPVLLVGYKFIPDVIRQDAVTDTIWTKKKTKR